MNMLRLLAFVSLFTIIGCGDDRTNKGQNRAAVEYFNQFITHDSNSDRDPNTQLEAVDIQGVNSVVGLVNNSVVLRLDSNGAYILYAAPKDLAFRSQYTSNLIPNTVSGNWNISGDNKLVLEGVAETRSFTDSAYNYNQNSIYDGSFQGGIYNVTNFTRECFPVLFSRDVVLRSNTINGGFGTAFGAIDENDVIFRAGTSIQFCQRQTLNFEYL